MKIGFVENLYGTPKGHSYVVKDMITALKEEGHKLHMYRIGNNPIAKDFPLPNSIQSYLGREIPEKEFREWLSEIKPDYCVFNEYAQWWGTTYDKLEICKELGIKTVGYLVQEKINWDNKDHYKLYNAIVCPTGWQTKEMRKHGLYNTFHVPWGVDMEEIDSLPQPEKKDKIVRFYHCAGSGGVDNRKNTEAVVEAYKIISDENTDLMITHIGNKVFGKNEILSFMKYADVLVNPSRWETIGLNNMEANACGIPVITTDMPPINEFMKDNVNGLLVTATETKSERVDCTAYDVDIEELSKKMALCKNEIVLQTLKNNSRHFAKINFDWKKNSAAFKRLFK